MKKIIFFFLNFCLCLTIVSCGESEEFESWEKKGYSPAEDISISSSASDNATVTFGQSYQHQVTTTGTYSGTITYSLSNQPDNMTISSSGLIEWTPTKASQITTHSNITITITTASGYVLTQTYDLTVTGTCTSGNVMAIWTGDQRTSTDSSKFLGNITAYTDNVTDNKTPIENYGYTRSGGTAYSVNKTFGPTASAGKGSLFFYNEHDNSSYIFLFYYFGEKGSSDTNDVDIDVLTSKNNSASYDVVDDDETIPLTAEQVLAFPQFTHDDVLSNSGMHPDTIAILEKELGLKPFTRPKIDSAKTFSILSEYEEMSYNLQKGIKIQFWRAFTFANSRVRDEYKLLPQKKTQYCPHPFTDFGVLWNGDVSLCCLDYDGTLKVGNVKNHSVEDVLKSIDSKKLRASMYGLEKLHPTCQKCQSRPVEK